MSWWFFSLLFLIYYTSAATINSPTQLSTLTFDYIIIGGGTAGLTLASRLTENDAVTVLVVEAGPSDEGILELEVPFLGPTLTPDTIHDWNYTVSPQTALNNRVFPFPRGRVLGGCSSINYMFHQYGSSADWDKIAAVTGDSGWSWQNMRQFVLKHERIVPPADGHNTSAQIIPSIHGTNGAVSISLPGTNETIDARVLNTSRHLPEFQPYNPDMGGGDQSLLGIGFLQSSIGGGARSSASNTYLQNATSRPNLTILLNTTVTKLVQTTANNPLFKAFRTIQITPSLANSESPSIPASSITMVSASREVILSAGSIGTPQILQLSGIGNGPDLSGLGITPVLNIPSVGNNLADHLVVSNVYTVSSNNTQDQVLRDSGVMQRALAAWQTNKTGMLTNTLANNLGFFRLPANSSIFQTVADPSAGPTAPHWEIIFSNFWFNPGVPQPPSGAFMSVPVILVSPLSRGNTKIKSNSPFEQPDINPMFLTNPFDVFTLRQAVLAVQRFTAAPSWSGFVTAPFGDQFIAATNDSTVDAYVRAVATGIFHPVGTASMSSPTVTTGVVQPNLTVKGTEGLRVVDASVFPFPLSAHPQGSTYILAERAAVIIQSST